MYQHMGTSILKTRFTLKKHIKWSLNCNKKIIVRLFYFLSTPGVFSILWCRGTGGYPKGDLVKVGYILDMKEKKTKILLYYWLPPGAYHKNLIIWIFFCLKSGECGPNFFIIKLLYRLKSYFSGWNLAKFCQKKKD